MSASFCRTRKPSAAALCITLALTLATSSAVRPQDKTLTPEKRGHLGKVATDFLYARNVPGISASLVLNDQPVWSDGFGLADLENFVAATSSTLYRLGSISKPISAIAILELSERGKLDLDAPVQKYCPAFPQKDSPITTRELLGHLGGIRHYNKDGKGDVPDDSARHFATMEESLQLFANDPLVAKPGTEFHYSTYGYTLLGCVLEGAASQKYVDFLRDNVFRPAQMDHTQPDNFFDVIPHRTRWYHKDSGGVVRNAGVLDSSYKIPGGGLISSADDMARFAIAVMDGKLLQSSTQNTMWTVQHTADGKPTGYALGWGVTDKFGLHLIAHTGGQQGTSTALIVVPNLRAAVVVLANMDSVDVEVLAEDLLKLALDIPDKSAKTNSQQ